LPTNALEWPSLDHWETPPPDRIGDYPKPVVTVEPASITLQPSSVQIDYRPALWSKAISALGHEHFNEDRSRCHSVHNSPDDKRIR
jgi:hypothetical protein